MGSSNILRRFIGIFRSPGNCHRRMMSAATSIPPWLMLPPATDGSGSIAYRFQGIATNKEVTCKNKIGDGGDQLQLPIDINLTSDVVFVGSSHGWLALYNRRNSDLVLSNPIADRHLKLPTLGSVDRVILSSASLFDEEAGPLALATFGPRRRLAFCSPRRRRSKWTRFGGEDRAYENIVYSSKQKRLFCLCQDDEGRRREDKDGCGRISLEGWDVDRRNQPPILKWAIRQDEAVDFGSLRYPWPELRDLKLECVQVKYLVCAEDSDELFVVVRHVNPRAGPKGSLEERVLLSKHRGSHFIRTPYKTVDFDVYRVDPEQGKVARLGDSLGGLAMFVGINHPFAIRASEVDGVKPDSVYFTDENRVVEPTRLERTNYGGHDNGIFDYRNKEFHPCCDLYPIEFEKIRKILPLPLWYTPTAII